MKKLQLPAFCLTLMAISCTKTDNDITPVAPVTDNYMTMTAGSSWNYETVDNIAVTNSSYTLTATNRDSTINSKPYHVYTNSGNNTSEYYNISDHDLYSFQSLPAAAGGTKAEVLYLKDNAAVNRTWDQPFNITISNVPVTVTLTNKIVEKSISRTVNGLLYNNVIHVQTSIAVSGVPAASLTSNINSYYAPKVGLIENSTIINSALLTINVNTQTRLKTSTIL